jgi:hypothetical protein
MDKSRHDSHAIAEDAGLPMMIKRDLLLMVILLQVGLAASCTFEQPMPNGCESQIVAPGPEAFVFDSSLGERLLVSASRKDPGGAAACNISEPAAECGQILAVPLAEDGALQDPMVMELRNRPESFARFKPLGLSLVRENRDGIRLGWPLLYILQKEDERSHVELYEVHADHLLYVDQPAAHVDLAENSNNILGTKDGRLFATLFNSQGEVLCSNQIREFVEDEWVEVGECLRGGNGIVTDGVGQIYVSAFYDAQVHVYDLGIEPGQLNFVRAINLETPGGALPDNLVWHESRLHVGAHTSIWGTFQHMLAEEDPPHAPSAVFWLEGEAEYADALLDATETPAAACSTAMVHGDWIYMTQLREPEIYRCPLLVAQ